MREWREYIPSMGWTFIYDMETIPEPVGIYVYTVSWFGYVVCYYLDPSFHFQNNPFVFMKIHPNGQITTIKWFGAYSKWGKAKCT